MRIDASATDDVLARRSHAALLHVASLDIASADELATRLYCYGRRPASPRWYRTLPRRDSTADYLGFRAGLPGGDDVRAEWHGNASSPETGWLSWSRRGRHHGFPPYKLYLSPTPAALRDAFGEIVSSISRSRAVSFKVGAGVYGMLRPDRFVTYFATFDALEEAARDLVDVLAEVPADGVPFSAALTANGLLSWASDPPSAGDDGGRQSWRMWLCARLGDALALARSDGRLPVTPVEFALSRIALEGVDPQSWEPATVTWRATSSLS